MQPSGVDNIRALVRNDKKKNQTVLIISAVLLFAFCIMILCFDYQDWIQYNVVHWINPWEAIRGVYYGIIYRVDELIYGSGNMPDSIMAAMINQPDFTGPVDRFIQVVLTLIAGAVLALSGAVYQSAMRNPMGVPTMLGVSSAVDLAKMMLLFYMGTEMVFTSKPLWWLYILGYGFSAIVMLIILAAGKISGGKRVSVVDMLLVGTVINRLVEGIVNYFRDQIDEETMEIYEALSERGYDYLEPVTNLSILIVVTLVVMTPILLMRFSYNAISFEDSEARCLGINGSAMRVYAVIAGGILTCAALIHYGDIGMLALIVPHICRYAFGADFRRVCISSALYGSFILLIGWFLTNFTWIGYYQIPVGTILNLVVLPILIIFRFRQDRDWD